MKSDWGKKLLHSQSEQPVNDSLAQPDDARSFLFSGSLPQNNLVLIASQLVTPYWYLIVTATLRNDCVQTQLAAHHVGRQLDHVT